jgi:capsular exopolysaccharide synthesis family protein
MSTKDDTSSLEQPTNGQSLVVPRTAPVVPRDSEWTTVAAVPRGAGPSHVDPSVYLHAVRRHWLLGTVLGVILGAVACVCAWFLLPHNYTAVSLLQVSMREEAIMSQSNMGYSIQQEFENYKNTQAQLLRSPFVLNTALRKPEISKLAMIQREKPNEIAWLQDHLSVSFPGDSEIMQVSLTDRDPKEVMKVVRAVVEAYKNEVIDKESAKKRGKYSDVTQIYRDKEEATRKKRAALTKLTEDLNTTDKDNLSVQQRVAIDLAAESRRELSRVQFELSKQRMDLVAAQGALKRLDQGAVPELELQEIIQRDALCRRNQELMAQLGQIVQQQEMVAMPGTKSTSVSRFSQQLAGAQAEFDTRRAELAELIKGAKRGEIQEVVADLTERVALQEGEEAKLREVVDKQQEEIQKIGKQYVEVQMAQTDLDTSQEALAKIGAEKEALEVELRTAARVQLVQAADEPPTYDNPQVNAAVSVMVGLLGLLLPMCGIVWWDVRKRRINSSEDVAKGLGVPVIGSVPIIPGRAIRRLNAPGAKNQQWNVRLTESIDSIAAKLLRDAAIDHTHVVLITSAVSGEGKTTLATQVAMSLARAGRRTVLVDFDLRRPAIDKAFQLPLHPGVSEALCGENEILDLVQPTGMKNLSVVTAGRCDVHALQALSSGVDERLFDELRGEYEFVVVDGSPILPVADSRYLSQHVDAVVLSIFRDFSRAPKVMAACEILESFGVHDVEAVVTSASEGGYGVIER